MFTGITQGTFPVVEVTGGTRALAYEVELNDTLVRDLRIGASVAIDGVCQTVVAVSGHHVRFEAIDETLRCTTLKALQVGRLVSVERSYRIGDELGGHEVAGHVRGTGSVVEHRKLGDNLTLRIQVPTDWLKYLLPKGFVALDGSSLTLGEIRDDGSFEVHLIPETLRQTNLGRRQVGEELNVELDHRTVAIVDTVERVLARREIPPT